MWKPTAFALALTLCVGMFWLPVKVSSPNERSRVYLAHALADRGEIVVTPEWERWGRVFDIAYRDGAFYSDKAPGSSVLAAPVVWLATTLNDDVSIETLVVWTRRGVMLPSTLLSLLALFGVAMRLGLEEKHAYAAMLALAAGSHLFHYGNAFFGHGLVLTSILVAWWLVLRGSQSSQHRALWFASAGAACGVAFAIEYQAALVAVAIGVGLLSDPSTRTWRVWVPLGVGAIPLVVAVLWYNDVAFGSPFATSYGFLYFETSVDVHDEGLWGVSMPSMASLIGLLLSPARGLLFASPALVLGSVLMWRRPLPARWLTVSGLIVALWFGYVATSFGMWHAGWGIGPRLMIPALGPMAVGAAWALRGLERSGDRWWTATFFGLGLASALALLVWSSTFAETPPDVHVPVRTIALPMLREGYLAPNLLPEWLGVAGDWLAFYGVVLVVVALWLYVALLYRGAWTVSSIAWGLFVATLWWCGMWMWPEDAAGEARLEFVRSVLRG